MLCLRLQNITYFPYMFASLALCLDMNCLIFCVYVGDIDGFLVDKNIFEEPSQLRLHYG